MSLPIFQLLRPRTLDEAIAFLSKHADDVKVIAGGTDLLPSMKQKLFTPPYVLDLRGVSELRGVHEAPDGWSQYWRADDTGVHRTLAAHSARLCGAVPRDQDRCVSGVAEHGHAGRQHLSRYALPLVQPVAAVAKELRLLPEERR